MRDNNAVVVIQFDKGYYEWGKTLVQSLLFNAPDDKVVIYSVNLSRSQRNELISLHKNLTIHNRRIPFISNKFKRHFMANRKANIFLRAIKNYDAKYYVLLDADMILINPINMLINTCTNFCAGLVYREYEIGYHMKLNASLIIINKYKGGERLIKEWVKTMRSNLLLKTVSDNLNIINIIRNKKTPYVFPVRVRKGSWFWDQLTLFYAAEKLKNEIKHLPVDVYLNSSFDVNAVLWSAHSGDKNIALQTYQDTIKEFAKKSPQ